MSYPLFLYELRYVHSPVVPGLTCIPGEVCHVDSPVCPGLTVGTLIIAKVKVTIASIVKDAWEIF
jgi:hypothetical protein